MKILHLPQNIASQISVTVQGLRSLGADARGLVQKHSVLQDSEGLESVDWHGRPRPIPRLIRGIRWRIKMIRAMAWADVIHWHWGGSTWRGLDLKIAAWLKKPRLIEFWGDDLREPNIASRDNPFIARMYELNPELRDTRSRETQKLFSANGFACLIPGHELADYLEPTFFPQHFSAQVRVRLDQYEPRYPETDWLKPLVVHAPSHKARKGTEAVLAAVEQLQKTHAFEFRLIHQIPRFEALKIVRECDIFLDQFTIGAEGLASCEAMAFGKPVVCYLKPSLLPRYPSELPIVSADQNNLAEVLKPLLLNGKQRHEIGRRSRRYVETHHDVRVVAAGLLKIYDELLRRKRS